MLDFIRLSVTSPSKSHRKFNLDVAVAFCVRALGAIAAFFMSLVIARVLGETESGYFFLALAMVTVLATLGRIGLDRTILRFIGAHFAEGEWGMAQAIFRRASIWVLLMSGIIAISLYVSAPWLATSGFGKPLLAPVLRAIAPAVVLLSTSTIIAFSLQAIRRTIQAILVLSVIIPITVASACWAMGNVSAFEAAKIYDAASFMALGAAVFWWYANSKQGTGTVRAVTLLSSCLPLLIATLMTEAVRWAGQFAAGAFLPPKELAHLAVAQRTATLISFVLIAVNLVVAPRFAALYQQGRHNELRLLAQHSVRLMLVFASPMLLVLLTFPEWILHWFGSGFEQGAAMLRLLAVGQFINVWSGSVTGLLAMSGYERDLQNLTLISGPIAIGFAFILTPLFGGIGAAVATAIALATQNLLAVYMVRRRLGFNTLAFWRSCETS